MPDVTRILSQIESGDPKAAEQLLPLVYHELRRLAAGRLRHEKPGQTLQATALVHEAYLRLVDGEKARHWDSRGHFFTAATEAMRRMLVEKTGKKGTLKNGGRQMRAPLSAAEVGIPPSARSRHRQFHQVGNRLHRPMFATLPSFTSLPARKQT